MHMLQGLYEIHTRDSVDWILGVQLDWIGEDEVNSMTSTNFSQPEYIESILRRFEIENCKPVASTMVGSFWTGIANKKSDFSVDEKVYQQMIGYLLYLGLRTRPDILLSVITL